MKRILLPVFCLLMISSSVVFGQSGIKTLTLQPDTSCAKVATLASCPFFGFDYINYANSIEFNAISGTNGGNPAYQRALVQFDISNVPAGATIQSAYLSLYYDSTSSNSAGYGHRNTSGPNDAYIQEVTGQWNAHTVTWATQPSTTTTNEAYLPADTINTEDYTNIDVTAMVQDGVNNLSNYNGWMFRLATESGYRTLLFCSSNYPEASRRPKLVINYSLPDSACLSFQYASCYGVDAELSLCTPQGYDSQNFGNSPEFNAIAGTNGGATANERSLIYWDLSNIPQNATITNAGLSLFFDPTSSNGQHRGLGMNDAYFQEVTSPWNENTVTWNTQPTVSPVNRAYVPPSQTATQDYTDIDMTAMVQDWVSNPSTNYGAMLGLITEQPYRFLIFCSSDYPDPTKHPRLDICYTITDGVNNINASSQVAVYPNPAADFVQVNVSGALAKQHTAINFTLYDVLGRPISTEENIHSGFVFHRNGLSGGIYFYSLNDKQGILKQGKIIFQ